MFFFFFFNDTATTEIYTLSLHDALPICGSSETRAFSVALRPRLRLGGRNTPCHWPPCSGKRRSEEHTSELQSLAYLVCRLLLEKKKTSSYNPSESRYANSPHTTRHNQDL